MTETSPTPSKFSIKRMPLIGLFAEHFGMEIVSGTYMNWMPDGFMIWVDGYDLPVSCITREFSFNDYPGNEEPDKDGKTVHVMGVFDRENYAINVFKHWFDDEVGEDHE